MYTILGWSNQGRWDGRHIYHAWRRWMHTTFQFRNL